MLSERQQDLLRMVVGRYLESGRPVGSAALARRSEIEWSPSTVRAELADLEQRGYLTHPHTSAGRVPTERGYRFYADALLAAAPAPPPEQAGELELARMRREVEGALRETTVALARVTDLMALVTAPPPSSAHIHRIEVLQLQPGIVMVVVIASNGAVTKRIFEFGEAVDTGLVEWASSFLNERLTGLALGSLLTQDRLDDPELGEAERGFLAEIESAFTGLEEAAGDDLYMEGASRLLSDDHASDLPRAAALMRALDRRATLLRVLRSTLDEGSVFLWIGDENPEPALRDVSVVGANYGLGYRNLGAVGVVGPMRMDYATAIASVRTAAGELSRFFADVYEGSAG